ncbi:MAG: RnfABCDGE type electron transport complex subunit G [Spirochaetaceae bacterium]
MRKMIMVLGLVTLISGVVLAGIYSGLIPRIEANQQAALERSLSALFEDAEEPEFEELDTGGPTIYRAETSGGDLLGYAVRVSATGYGGEIRLLVGISPDLSSIAGLQIVEQVETPGLGARITEEDFRDQFEDLDPGETISYVKNEEPDSEENEIQAISGATISSEAVVDGVNADVDRAVEILREEEGQS